MAFLIQERPFPKMFTAILAGKLVDNITIMVGYFTKTEIILQNRGKVL